jgi:hypothetical protein
MMLPNVKNALTGWMQPVTVKTLARTTVDFVLSESVTVRVIPAVVQPTQKTSLNADTLNWSQPHITIHTPERVHLGEVVEWMAADYKVVEVADWSQYGYFEAVCEATGKAVLQETEAP